jgi:hypothetical protein
MADARIESEQIIAVLGIVDRFFVIRSGECFYGIAAIPTAK